MQNFTLFTAVHFGDNALSRLAKRSALTIKQVRNAIAALAKARKIIVRPTSLHTVVTICNYEDYVI